jgi:hypothetical protein
MSDPKSSDAYILKILSGVQIGVEASLTMGEYTLGSGSQDDIQLVDLSLKPGHLRIRLSASAIELRGLAGSIHTSAGLTIGAESDWHAIAPLDVVTAGTSRFALGAPNAQWTTLADAGPDEPGAGKARVPHRDSKKPDRRVYWNAAAVAAVAGAALWFAVYGRNAATAARMGPRDDLAITREALAPLPFANRIRVKQDVDGAIFVTGHVDTPVQRRAVLGALEQAGSPARARIWVVDAIRADLDELIRSERLALTAQVAPDGTAALDGLILNEANARRFVSLVQSQVLGLSRLESRIRTAETLLGAVRDLARQSQIAQFVIFRLDGELIEANGVLPVDRVDAWVGFLQAFAQRHAQEIGLRSFVQLQSAAGQRPEQAIGIGRGADGVMLDPDRLRQGLYGPRELFPPAAPPQTAPPQALQSQAKQPPSEQSTRSSVGALIEQLRNAEPAAPERLRSTEAAAPEQSAGARSAPLAARPPLDSNEKSTNAARALIERWRDGTLGEGPLRSAMDLLAASQRGAGPLAEAGAAAPRGAGPLAEAERKAIAERLLPIFADPRQSSRGAACWPGSRLTSGNVSTALFWLDLASLSEQLTVRSLSLDMQGLVLEAALSPQRTAACAKGGAAAAQRESIYLAETMRNPGFIRYIARDLGGFPMEITGANIRNPRFIQTRAGEKIFEGGAPDAGSRLALIGELGTAVQQRDGLSAVIFGRDLNWIVTD